MRVTYAAPDVGALPHEERKVYDSVATRRGASGLLPLDHALLHSFPIIEGWNTFFSAIRTQTSLPVEIIELAICRVALHCGANIPWRAYIANLKQREGWNEEKLRVVQDRNPAEKGALTKLQWVVLRYADAMTANVVVEEGLFRELKMANLDEKQIVELTATIAGYKLRQSVPGRAAGGRTPV